MTINETAFSLNEYFFSFRQLKLIMSIISTYENAPAFQFSFNSGDTDLICKSSSELAGGTCHFLTFKRGKKVQLFEQADITFFHSGCVIIENYL